MTLLVPFPPSVNTYWRTFRGRMILSAKARQYRQDVIASLRPDPDSRSTIRPLTCLLAVTVSMHPPDKRRRDVDNYAKALLDAMKYAGIYEDDSQIVTLTTRWDYKAVPKGMAAVQIQTNVLCEGHRIKSEEDTND